MIEVRGFYRDDADGCAIRLGGYGDHEALEDDADEIFMDSQWFELMCASRLAQRRTTDREWASWAVQWQREADVRRFQNFVSYEPNAVRVR